MICKRPWIKIIPVDSHLYFVQAAFKSVTMSDKKESTLSKLIEVLTLEPRFQVDNQYLGDRLSFEQKIEYLLSGPSDIAELKERLLKLAEHLLMGGEPSIDIDLQHCALALTRVILLLDFLHQQGIRKELAHYIKDPDQYATPYERWLQMIEQQ
jgi:hypothetical protein